MLAPNVRRKGLHRMLDQILDLLSELPIGLIIFAAFMLMGLFGRDDKKQAPQTAPRDADMTAPREPSTYASDDRQYGNPLFDESGSAFEFGADEEEFRGRTQWGQTKYGFDENEWGSTFDDDHNDDSRWGSGGDKRDSEPRIEIG